MLEVLSRLPNETAREYSKRVLSQNIVRLNLEPGTQLQESELCAQLGISRTPVREAILELAQVKIIDIYPQRGTYVSKIDSSFIEEVRYLRYVLESDIVTLACDSMDPETLESLEENIQLQNFYLERNPDKFLQLDCDFHYQLYRVCAKEFLYKTVERVAVHFDRARKLSYIAQIPTKIVRDHEEMVKAISAGDKKAARAVAEAHMRRSLEDEPLLRQKYPDYYI